MAFLDSLQEKISSNGGTDDTELEPLWETFLQTNLSINQNRLDKIFFTDSVKKNIEDLVIKMKKCSTKQEEKELVITDINKLRSYCKEKHSKLSSVRKLSDLSRTLSTFIKSSHTETIGKENRNVFSNHFLAHLGHFFKNLV